MGEEARIEKRVCDVAKKRGWLTFKFVSPGAKGVPDRIFFKNGDVFMIEFKAKGKKLSPLQKLTIDKFTMEHITVFVVDNYEDGLRVVDRMTDAQ